MNCLLLMENKTFDVVNRPDVWKGRGMKKEPWLLYIFRLLSGWCFLWLMGMLYWSSLLVEEDLRQLKHAVAEIKQNQNASLSTGVLHSAQSGARLTASHSVFASGSHIDATFPNLLQEDSFYAKTLPKMLGPKFTPQGVLRGAAIGKPDNLHPFSNWGEVSSWIRQCTVSVSNLQFGKYETYAPDMAIKMEERKDAKTGDPEYWIHLRAGVYWEPLTPELFSANFELAPHFFERHPVTAYDFKFYIDAMLNPYNQEAGAVSGRTYYEDLKEIEVVDPLTFIVRWKTIDATDSGGKQVRRMKYIAKQLTGGLSPLASFIYQYFPDGQKIVEEDDKDPDIYRKSSVWAQNFANHWAKNMIPSCGAWSCKGMTDRQIAFVRNNNHYNPLGVLVQGEDVQFKDSADMIWQDFKGNKLDAHTLQPDQVIELAQFMETDLYKEQAERGSAIKRIDYLARSYSYIGWNQARPYFKSRKVRQALTMAIDRERLISENLNGMGEEITGTFFKHSSAYDHSILPLPFDPEMAKKYLQEEGWYDSDGDGIIDKLIDGVRIPFQFSLTYFVKSQTGKSICEYVAMALKSIGIVCNLHGVDMADISAVFDDKNFDALLLAWGLGAPPEDPKQLWLSAGSNEKGSSNVVGFSNPEADKLILQLQYEYDPQKRVNLYHQFDRILYDEQPYTFLYSPKVAFLYREYLQNVFIPADRRDLIPGADVEAPQGSIFWLKKV